MDKITELLINRNIRYLKENLREIEYNAKDDWFEYIAVETKSFNWYSHRWLKATSEDMKDECFNRKFHEELRQMPFRHFIFEG